MDFAFACSSDLIKTSKKHEMKRKILICSSQASHPVSAGFSVISCIFIHWHFSFRAVKIKECFKKITGTDKNFAQGVSHPVSASENSALFAKSVSASPNHSLSSSSLRLFVL